MESGATNNGFRIPYFNFMIYILFFIVLLLAELLYFKIADKFNIIDKPNQRSSHRRITLRGGGIVFYFGVLLYSLWFGIPYPWFLAGLSAIAAISMADDIRPVPNRVRLIVHFTAMFLLFVEWGLHTGLPWWYIPIALIFCTGIINAFNFMDGINGITGSYSLSVMLALLWLNKNVVNFTDQPFLYTVVISLLVFCLFNFRRKARCFAGDVGSVSVAFIVLFAMGSLMLATKDLSYIVFLSVYGVDSVLTIVHRLILRENIFEAHRKHAYQIMANELSIPHIGVATIYMGLQLIINVGYLTIPKTLHWYYLTGILLLLGIVYVFFTRSFFYLHLSQKDA